MSQVRTRFAPSPTGYLHIGGARTALFNYLFARHHGGKFILRIEDTDRERSTPEAIQAILDAMKWLELDYDEGPFYQTERYSTLQGKNPRAIGQGQSLSLRLHAAGSRRQAPAGAKRKTQTRLRRHLSPARRRRFRRCRRTSPTRSAFARRSDGTTVVKDLVKGDVVFDNRELDDLIIARSDGTPTYNFCVVVDDIDMNITHIIRGDDHLSNTPRQIQLYQALGP